MNPKMLAGLCACTLSAAAVAEPTTLTWTGGGNDRLLSTVGRDARAAEAQEEAEADLPIQSPLSAAPRHFRS